ncbi:MAG TPA: aspartate/glutamate racemase family protein, partial [Acidimicrobiia bacterium]
RFAAGVEVLTRACPEWVELVERGQVEGAEVEASISTAVVPIVDEGADVVVLACTHFSFLGPAISQISGLEVVDPASAVAAQVARVAPDVDGTGELTLAASGDTTEFAGLASALASMTGPVIPFSS